MGLHQRMIECYCSCRPNQASDPEAVWNSIPTNTQAAIDKSIDTAIYSLVQSELLGFSQLKDEYYFATMSDPVSTPEYISSVYISCVTQVIRQEQLFKNRSIPSNTLAFFISYADESNSVINTHIQSLFDVSTTQSPDLWNKVSDELNHFYMSLYPTGGSIGPVSHILLSNLTGVFNTPFWWINFESNTTKL
ncbi:hypothetical protein PPL_08474 [Heterostelium album PN500]|uniref:Uncharacterized protein n=1 Tax=Heterostelium pallidum (strain ATCC 26659 / Pp 5 / PN500) TaxID=670386 RepID=D3BIA6_HETP5|nr:hypothetical protein PPL_08474 [Heterostelium album PN500]EFA79006.1 hypothetical protein PPL_08474 [Heterostelium album PN500]|eukprot:XP_020431130.1 hypothetical protein PPL_08474 [Heterostelium album PN500]